MTTHRIDVGGMVQVPLTPRATISRTGTDAGDCTICLTIRVPPALPAPAVWRVASEGFVDEVCDAHLLDALLEALPPRTMT